MENIAKIIEKSYNIGVKAINLNTNPKLIESYEIAIKNGIEMEVIGIIGKSDVNYMFPDFEQAKKSDWQSDLEKLSKYNPSIVLIDEFIVDSYDWDLIKEILEEINKKGIVSGLITSFPFKTSEKLLKSPILDLFQVYMVPINKLGYMMDTDTFLEKEREDLKQLLIDMDKKIIVNKILAAGVQRVEEAYEFLNSLDYVDMVTIGVSSEKEIEEDFNLFKN
ncbi:MAG: hypothetical protein LBM96_01520 [Methanobrevibacter sp.]|nr:hypothetical protein [Candidatus Methanoflexus mossambicus]